MSALTVVDRETGETMPVITDKKLIGEYVSKLSDPDKGSLLTKVNFLKRVTTNIEKAIKAYVNPTIELDEDGVFMFQNWRITQKSTPRFSETALLEGGNKKDIEIWKRLKKKYTVVTSSYNYK